MCRHREPLSCKNPHRNISRPPRAGENRRLDFARLNRRGAAFRRNVGSLPALAGAATRRRQALKPSPKPDCEESSVVRRCSANPLSQPPAAPLFKAKPCLASGLRASKLSTVRPSQSRLLASEPKSSRRPLDAARAPHLDELPDPLRMAPIYVQRRAVLVCSW